MFWSLMAIFWTVVLTQVIYRAWLKPPIIKYIVVKGKKKKKLEYCYQCEYFQMIGHSGSKEKVYGCSYKARIVDGNLQFKYLDDVYSTGKGIPEWCSLIKRAKEKTD
jgi:hypothetical protein